MEFHLIKKKLNKLTPLDPLIIKNKKSFLLGTIKMANFQKFTEETFFFKL